MPSQDIRFGMNPSLRGHQIQGRYYQILSQSLERSMYFINMLSSFHSGVQHRGKCTRYTKPRTSHPEFQPLGPQLMCTPTRSPMIYRPAVSSLVCCFVHYAGRLQSYSERRRKGIRLLDRISASTTALLRSSSCLGSSNCSR